jgi:hypothetical protein
VFGSGTDGMQSPPLHCPLWQSPELVQDEPAGEPEIPPELSPAAFSPAAPAAEVDPAMDVAPPRDVIPPSEIEPPSDIELRPPAPAPPEPPFELCPPFAPLPL